MTNNRGFTIIELLVVVLIIGILSAVALPQYTISVEKARLTEGFITAKAITDSMQRYKQMHTDSCPTEKTGIDADLQGGTWNADGTVFSTKNFTFTIATGCQVNVCRRDGAATTCIVSWTQVIPASDGTSPRTNVNNDGTTDGKKLADFVGAL